MASRALGACRAAAGVIAAMAGAAAGAGPRPLPLPLLPMPAAIERGAGGITIADGAAIATPAGDGAAATAARLLAGHVARERGITLRPSTSRGVIRIERDAAVTGAEAYRLTVRRDGIRITAATPAGLVRGAMTLAQLLSPDARTGRPVRVPALDIRDAPRFAWRGLMIDTARHFQPLPSLFLIVDQMAGVKLNVLHLHLTDDQGWRFEVKRYPGLTRVGAWRRAPSTGGAAPAAPVGGFYTQDELRRLVAYAADRGIAIVPEIDLPGHAQALVAAYPEFGVMGDAPVVSHDWGVNPYLLDPGPRGVAFIEGVLDELIDVFPGTFVHLGGDEAVKDQWERSPAVQARMKALGIADENAMQSWLIDTLGRYLQGKGRRLIGWDEILEGGLPASASVMSWRGDKGAVDAANQGHDVVLSPAPTLYLDSLQSDQNDEPPGRLSIQTLADVYRYEPMPAAIAPDRRGHVLGAQANAWSEYLSSPQQVQHAVFPRIAALAETTWSSAPRAFTGFVARLVPQIDRWRRGGVAVADSAFAVTYAPATGRGDALRTGRATVALATQAAIGTIRYTLDGSAPGPRARRYVRPLVLPVGAIVRAAAFDAAGHAVAAPRTLDLTRTALLARGGTELVSCPRGSLGLRVPALADSGADRPAFDVNLFDTCTAYPAAPLNRAGGFTVDVRRLARNYGLAHDAGAVRRHHAVTAHGELLVLAGCQAGRKGPPDADAPRPVAAAAFPLPDPAAAPATLRFTGALPAMAGDRDICFQFTSPIAEPFYAVEHVQLTERR